VHNDKFSMLALAIYETLKSSKLTNDSQEQLMVYVDPPVASWGLDPNDHDEPIEFVSSVIYIGAGFRPKVQKTLPTNTPSTSTYSIF
jgi:hypothetical protein